MVSRIERVVREVSDLRAFYLNLQKVRRETQGRDKEPRIEEGASSDEAKQSPKSEGKPKKREKSV